MTNNADNLALLNRQTDILERPNRICQISGARRAAANNIARPPKRRLDRLRNHIPKRVVLLGALLHTANKILLRNIVNLNRRLFVHA